MQKIVPHLWFSNNAVQAAELYTSIFPNSKITSTSILKDTPSGDCDVVSFDLMGYSFMSLGAEEGFKLNPSISIMVNFDPSQDLDAENRIETIWNALIDGGKTLMDLGEYPFSKKYGWVEDKFGMSWQLILTEPEGEDRPLVLPSLLFVNDVCGKAKEASDFYISVFKDSKRGAFAPYPAGMEPDKEGTAMFTDFMLENQWFVAMDSAHDHKFNFNEAFSFIVNCETQEEIDYYWEKLSAVPESEQCGWLKDRYGVSWQIVPTELHEIMSKASEEQMSKITQAFLPMKKLDIQKIKEVL